MKHFIAAIVTTLAITVAYAADTNPDWNKRPFYSQNLLGKISETDGAYSIVVKGKNAAVSGSIPLLVAFKTYDEDLKANVGKMAVVSGSLAYHGSKVYLYVHSVSEVSE